MIKITLRNDENQCCEYEVNRFLQKKGVSRQNFLKFNIFTDIIY